ncbi:hypothetical protein Poli38472_003589 [Pythium oligandrum]|uniref:Uncharacterized protein n=1 Tax=Pythium oligandrum TaxID=41045 RepID=A0A8K1CMI8_PYTOL|nr:hypothetical protein Poli38472_003589 [Pythium oligandrum]|eukprot:TMW65824.1 hypothetical protein Poli38472_003589 [Pythium oligandrum]
MPQELLQALSHMLSDTNEAIVCFGVFILLQYASQSSHWHGLINEVLITQCQQLSTSAQRQSTQWLLRQLQDAMGGDAW